MSKGPYRRKQGRCKGEKDPSAMAVGRNAGEEEGGQVRLQR